jgi:hypothetical protein
MMKNYLLLFVLFFGFQVVFGQDILNLKNATTMTVYVTEVTPTTIKFKKSNDGPMYTMNLSDVISVTYSNGTTDNFSTAPVVNNNNNNNNYAQNSNQKTKDKDDDEMLAPSKRYGGPRIGLTYIDKGTTRENIADAFNRSDITPFVSQFGWQFETRVFTLESGGAGLVEFVPLIGGLEQGLFLPSANLLFGFRAANGVEFGVGPSGSLAGVGIVMALGASFKVGKVTFPFNVAFSPNIKKIIEVYDPATQSNKESTSNSGLRLSLFIGFNSRKG